MQRQDDLQPVAQCRGIVGADEIRAHRCRVKLGRQRRRPRLGGGGAFQELRAAVYALLYALDFTLDEAAPIIGRLVEIDSRIVLIERLWPFKC